VRALAVFFSVLMVGMLTPSAALSTPPSNAFRYFHDADGRLKAAINPEGDTAVYNWDAAGNLLSISRHASSTLSVVQLSPARGEVGATVTIEGTGFSTTPASNTVKFNGTAASVSAASATSLTVKVPVGATTGSVTVSTPSEGPVTSTQEFTVAESSAPHISSISPTVAVAEEEITISGSNFEPAAISDTVTLNRTRPEVTSSSSGSIKFKVPMGTLGGHVSVATAAGSSIGPDLFIPPSGTSTSKVGSTGRFSLGESKTVEFTAEKVALRLVDGKAGKRMSMTLSESTIASGTVSIWSPSGTQLVSASFSKSGGFIETAALPVTGTYTVLLSPGASAGSAKLTSYEPEDISGGSIIPAATAEGTTQHVAISTPGQNARYSVTMSAGEKVALRTNKSEFTGKYTIKWLNSEGETVYSENWNEKENWFWDSRTFASAGTYTLLLDPVGAATGSVDLQLWETPDLTGQTITPSEAGGSATSTIKVPGQREMITFSGTKEQRLSWAPSESTIKEGGTVTVLRPNGATLNSGNFTSGFHEPVTLPETGTYTFLVDPATTGTNPVTNGTGSLKLTGYFVPEDISGGSITPAATAEGTTQHVAIPNPGQNARYSVTMSAGEKVALRTNKSEFTGKYSISWLNSEGKSVYSLSWAGKENWFWDPKTFAGAGTYTLLLDPEGSATGSVDLQLWETPDLTGQTVTPSEAGGSVTSTIKVPGQRELITFSGTKEQKFAWAPSESTIKEGGTVTVLRPNGATLNSSSFTSGFHDPVSLPETGAYTFVVDPATTGTEAVTNGTGSLKLKAYFVSEDLTGSITPAATAEGTTQHVAIPNPGQNARYSVTMSAGEKVALRTNKSEFTGKYTISWLNSEGKSVYSLSWAGKENWFWDSKTFAGAGTYTLLLDPEGTATGSVDLQLWETPDLTGQTITPSEGGGSATSTIKVPGQRELITFSGTKEQRLTWTASESTIKEGGTVTLLKPSGAEFASGTFSGFHEPVTLPETGTYTYVIDPTTTALNPVINGTGSVKLTANLIPEDLTGSITPAATAEGTTQKVSISYPGQNARYSVTMSAGEKVALRTNKSEFSGKYTIKWLNSKGETAYSENWAGKENWFWDSKTFASAGTYTLLLDPEGTATGSVDLQLWETPDLTGQTITPSEGGGSATSTIKVPGQRELITFSGTASQLVTVKGQESTIASGTMWVLKPDGTKLSGSEASFTTSTNARKELTLPTTGTYTIVVDPPATGTNPVTNGTGSVKVIVYLGSHVAWYSPIWPGAELASYMTAAPRRPQSYSDTSAGAQTVAATAPKSAAAPETSSSPVPKAHHDVVKGRPHSPHASTARKAQVSKTPRHRARLHRESSTRLSPVKRASASSSPRHIESSIISPAMRVFKPDAADAWHPLRTTRGVHGWEAGERQSPWANVAPLQADPGTTALAGQALKLDGLPLAGVRVSLEGSSVSAETDNAGRFLLAGVPAGHQVLVIDGETAPGKERYGSYETGVDLADHQTTTLGYTIWLTPLDSEGDQQIDSPTSHETRLTTPRIPGLEVRIPAGTIIKDAAGHTVKKLNISPIPVSRPPFPLPPFVDVSLYFTVQPGRAYLSKGAQIVYPNWSHLPPGQRVDFWNYDANDRGWYVYGQGTVTPDGKQVMPDPGVRVWEFTGAMISGGPKPPVDGPFLSESTTAGDPVDMRSGLFVYHANDLVLPDSIPILIERAYRPQDSNSYSFGKGTTSLYDMRLWSEHNYTEADLIMPDGGRVHYVRTSPGTGYKEAVYRASNTPGQFFGSTITWDESVPGWNLTLTNGLTFVFGELAPLQAIRDQYGNELTISRTEGQKGNITQITSPHGRWVKFVYDGSNRITEITDNGGQHLKYEYTSGFLTKATDAAGRETKYAYNGSGQMTSVTDARGNKYLETAYDANGRVEKQTNGDGGTFEFAYKVNGEGQVESTTVTEPRGNKRKVAFNSEGFPTSETVGLESEDEETLGFERQAKTGLLLSTADPLGRKTAFEYDSNGNVTEVTRLAGTGEAQTTKYAYEPGTSRLTEETDPLGNATKYKYGGKGELLKLTDPLGHETTLEYNGEGQPIAITNAENATTKLNYEHGDLSTITDPLGREAKQFVDSLGRVVATTSPGGQQTRYSYNEDGQPTTTKSPSGAETTVEYDADGDPIAVIDPRGHKTTATYDVMDRIESETDPLEHTAHWAYDKAGLLEEAKDRRGKVSTFSYDPLGRLASARFGVSGEAAESTIGYEYDKGNRPTNVNDSSSGEYVPSYDNLDRLTGLEGPNGSVGYEYDAAGRRKLMAVSGLGIIGYEYDKANRLTEIASGGQVVSFGYNKANRLESLTLPDGIKQLYGYDKAGEPTSIAYKKGESTLGELDYAYDANGRTEATWGSYARLGLPEAMSSAKYNAGNELIEREGKELGYDADGNLTSDGASEYEWDARGQLAGISGASSASFGYDPFGRRISKTLGGTTTDLLYDGTNVVQESVKGSVTANLLTGLGADRLYSRTSSSGTSSYLTNLLGSTIALANGSGEVKTSYTYDPFGGATATGEASDNPFQYTGRENDGAGLQYNRARYYSSALGRFISQDPTGFAGSGSNLYRYVGDNPLDLTDPSGKDGAPVPSPAEIEHGFEEGINKIGGAIGGLFEGGGHAIEEGGKYAIEHPGTTLEAGSLVVCVAPVAVGYCFVAVGEGFIVKSGENYSESNGCTAKFLEMEGTTVVTTGANAGAGLLFPGLEGMGLIGKGTIGLSRAGRTALNSPPSILGGALSGVTAKHGSATSSC
jgi:RHS repeat-associated protein